MRSIGLYFACFLAVVSTWASEPGQPLDCRDWVFLEPGLSCDVFAPPPCDNEFCVTTGGRPSRVVSNDGRLLGIRARTIGTANDCTVGAIQRFELLRFDGNDHTVLAYVDERCSGYQCKDSFCYGSCWDTTSVPGVYFDRQNGALLFVVTSRLLTGGTPSCLGSYEPQRQVLAIRGFATTFEILQSFTPTAGSLSFRVPTYPEAFQHADYFDTYVGDLGTVGDWSQAQPLQCGYPATPPSVGDYLTVQDTLPIPTPGHGYYYVTAVNYMGQRRYGRKSSGGVLTGRDPALLPKCAR